MVNKIQDILTIEQAQDLIDRFKEFDEQIEDAIAPVEEALELNISSDVPSLHMHMTEVERWRVRVCRFYSFATAFVEHAKSKTFLLPKSKESTEMDREAQKKTLSAGPTALQARLDMLISSIDSRVNLCKKLLGIESDNAGIYRRAF
jgi:hypothetical protein